MARPTFGLEFFRVDDQPQPVVGANMDVVGIVGPCDTADEETFPLNTPVYMYSNDLVMLAKLGDGSGYFDGYIADAINGINAQLADFQIAAQIVIVRTEYGTAADCQHQAAADHRQHHGPERDGQRHLGSAQGAEQALRHAAHHPLPWLHGADGELARHVDHRRRRSRLHPERRIHDRVRAWRC